MDERYKKLLRDLFAHYDKDADVSDAYLDSLSKNYNGDNNAMVKGMISHYDKDADVTDDYINQLYGNYGIQTSKPQEKQNTVSAQQQQQETGFWERLGRGLKNSALSLSDVFTEMLPQALDAYKAMDSGSVEYDNLFDLYAEQKQKGGAKIEQDKRLADRKESLRDLIRKQEAQALQNKERKMISSFSDVNTVGDFLELTGTSIGQAVGQIPLAILTGGASSFFMESGGVYGDAVEKKAQKLGIKPEEVIDRGLDQEALQAAMVAGGLSAALDKVGADKVIGAFKKTPLGKSFTDKVKKVFTSTASEGLTEGAQSVVTQTGANVGSGETLSEGIGNVDWKQVRDEGISGALGGGGLSVIGSAFNRNPKEQAKQEQQTINQEQVTTNQEQETQNQEQGTINQTSKLTDLQGKLSQVAEDLKKEGLPESLKSKLEAKYQSISQEVSAEEEAIKAAQEASKTAQKQLSEEKQLNAVLSDPNASDTMKEAAQEALADLQAQKQELDKQIQSNPKVAEVLQEMFSPQQEDLSVFDDLFAQADAEQAIAESEIKNEEAGIKTEQPKTVADDVLNNMSEKDFDKYDSAKAFFENNNIQPTDKQQKEIESKLNQFAETADMIGNESKRPAPITDRAERRKKTDQLLFEATKTNNAKSFNANFGKDLLALGYKAENRGKNVVLVNTKGETVKPIGYEPDEDADYAIPFEKRTERTQQIAKKLAELDIKSFIALLGSQTGKTGLNQNAIKLAQKAFKQERLNPSAAIAIDLIESRDAEGLARGYDLLSQLSETPKQETPKGEPQNKTETSKENPYIGKSEKELANILSSNKGAYGAGFIEESEYQENLALINDALSKLNQKPNDTKPTLNTDKESTELKTKPQGIANAQPQTQDSKDQGKEKQVEKSIDAFYKGDIVWLKDKNKQITVESINNVSKDVTGFDAGGNFVQTTINNIETLAQFKAKKQEPTKTESKEETKPQAEVKKSTIVNAELDNLWDEFNDIAKGKLYSGLDPQLLAIGTKLVGKYIELGVVKFGEIVTDTYNRFGADRLRELMKALKASYGSYIATSDREDLSDIKEIRSFDVDNFIKQQENGQVNIPTPIQQDLPKLSERELSNKANDAIRTEQVDEGTKSDSTASGQEKSGTNQPKSESNRSGRDSTSGNLETELGKETERQPANQRAVSTNRDVARSEDLNHRIADTDVIVEKGDIGKLNANMQAILLLKKLQAEKRNATPEEKKVLAKFVGWGGIGNKFLVRGLPTTLTTFIDKFLKGEAYTYQGWSKGKSPSWGQQTFQLPSIDFADFDKTAKDIFAFIKADERLSEHLKPSWQEDLTLDKVRASLIRNTLSEAEFIEAENSTKNAHYTSREVIKSLWNLAERLGFKGGKVLESSAGIGHFFGLMPENLADKSQLTGVELESTTGNLLSKLYPQADIQVKGFQDAQFKDFGNIDLAITNVPFASEMFTPIDKRFPDISKGGILGLNLHNYMIAKNLLALKEGGIGIFITSSSTLDGEGKSNKNFRTWAISEQGGNSDFMGAIRLPSNAFAENAGTEVTTDILIFRKRDGNPHPQNQNDNFVNVVTDRMVEVPAERQENPKEGETIEEAIRVNKYYQKHPENLIGKMYFTFEKVNGQAVGGSSYGGRPTQTAYSPQEVTTKTLDKIFDTLPKDLASSQETQSKQQTTPSKDLISQESKGKEVTNKATGKKSPAQQVYDLDYIPLRDKLLNLIRLEQDENASNELIEAERKSLNKLYDNFVYKYGNLTGTDKKEGNANLSFLEEDNHWSLVSSLESKKVERLSDGRINRIRYGKADILSKRVIFPNNPPTQASNMQDAISISLAYMGKLDLPYLSALTNTPQEEIRNTLLSEGLVFENPQNMRLELPEEYLSGFVREKLKSAQEAAKTNEAYQRNVDELSKVIKEQLPDVPFSLITVSLGNTWIPPKVMQEFADSVFGGKSEISRNEIAETNKWLVNGNVSSKAIQEYKIGERRVTPLDLLELTLNRREYTAFDSVEYTNDNGNKSKKSVKNQEDTTRGQELQEKLRQEFLVWIKAKEGLHPDLEKLYNETFNGNLVRDWSEPNFEYFPNASHNLKPRAHQKRVVRRALTQSTLIAHGVGTGKTIALQSIAMEMRRLGLAKKPLIVVQNSTLEDFANKFRALYPSAKLLVPTQNEMKPEGRKQLFGRISTGDWDAIILPQSQLDMIPDSEERKREYVYQKIRDIEEAMSNHDPQSAEYRNFKQQLNSAENLLEGRKKKKNNAKKQATKNASIANKAQKQLDRKTDEVLTFEEMGVDALLLDEAHEYKRLGFMTEMKNIKGIDTAGAKKSLSLYLKTRWIQEKKAGKNVIFATGTPISNTMAELWTFLNYLRPDIVERFKIKSFDDFANNFGKIINSFEQRGSGDFKEVQRFAEYTNAPELMKAWLEIADVILSEDVSELRARKADEKWEVGNVPKLKDGKFTEIKLPKSELQKKQTAIFKARLAWFDNLQGKLRREYSWIPAVTMQEAKRGTIDLRLLYGNKPELDDPNNKLNQSVKEAFQIWKDSKDKQGVQAIFCDELQKADFNSHREIKRKLVELGIPAGEIEIMTEPKYAKVKTREAVFQKAKEGKVRIVIGGTTNMGIGVNIQDKLVALHHLDAPKRPMDFEQRNGRILRQGNTNEEVQVLTYAVEETLDATAYKRLGIKQTFVNQAMKGEIRSRNMTEALDDSEEFFKSFSAELAGDERVVDLKRLESELTKAKQSKAAFEKTMSNANADVKFFEQMLKEKQMEGKGLDNALTLLDKHFPNEAKIQSIEIDGKKTDLAEQKDLYPILNSKIDELVQDYYQQAAQGNTDARPQTKIKVNGLDLTISFIGFASDTNEEGKREQTRKISYFGAFYDKGDSRRFAGITGNFKSAEGFVQSFARQKTSIESEIGRIKEYESYATEQIENNKSTLKQQFDESKITDLQEKVNTLKGELMKENSTKNEYNLPDAALSADEALFFVLNKKKAQDLSTKSTYEITIDNSEETDESVEDEEVVEQPTEAVAESEAEKAQEPQYIQPLTKISEVKKGLNIKDPEGNTVVSIDYDFQPEERPDKITVSFGLEYRQKSFPNAEKAFVEINRIIRAENKQIKDLYEAKNKTTLPPNKDVVDYWDNLYNEIDTAQSNFFEKYKEFFGDKAVANSVTNIIGKKIVQAVFESAKVAIRTAQTIDEVRQIIGDKARELYEKLKAENIYSDDLVNKFVQTFSDTMNKLADKAEQEIAERTEKLGADKEARKTVSEEPTKPIEPISGAGKKRMYGAMESVLDKEAFTEVLQDFITTDPDNSYRQQKDSDLWQEIQDDFAGKTLSEQIDITEKQLLEANVNKNASDKLVFQTYFLLHRLTDEANQAKLEGDTEAYRQFGAYQGRLMTLVAPIGTEAGRIVRQFTKISMAIRLTPAGLYEYHLRSIDRKREEALKQDKAGEKIEETYKEAFSPEAHKKTVKIVIDILSQKMKDLKDRYAFEKRMWESSLKEKIKTSKSKAEAEIREGKSELKSILSKIMPKGKSSSASMSFTLLPIDPDKLDTQTKPLFKALLKIAKGYVKLGTTSALEVYHKVKGDLEKEYEVAEIATIDEFVQAAALKSVGEKWKSTNPEMDLLKKNEELLAEFVKNKGKELSQIVEDHYAKPDGKELATKLEAQGLPKEVAEAFAKQVESEIDKRTRQAKEKSLEKIYGGKSVASITDTWKKSRDKVIDESMKGISKEKFTDSFATRFDFTSLSDSEKDVLKDYSERISMLPNASEFQARLRREVATWLTRKDMPNIRKVGSALMELFYVGMLSSPVTLYRNAKTLTAIMFTELPKGIMRNPKQAGLLLKSMQLGAKRGYLLFKQAVRDGIFDLSKEYHQMQEAKMLETFLHNGDKRIIPMIGKAYVYLPTMMYRILIGSDILFRETLQELRVQELALRRLQEESPKDKAFWQDYYDNYVNTTTFDKNRSAQDQAIKDTENAINFGVKIGNKEEAIKRRFYEILESQTLPNELDEAKYWSSKKTLTGEPEGYLGWLHEKAIAPVLQKFTLGKLIVPFTRVPSNIVNMWVENSALGFISAFKSYRYGTYIRGTNQKISKEEYYDRLWKAGIATALHVTLLAMVLGDDDDEEDKFFDVTGGGFNNYTKNKVLSQSKDKNGNVAWREYSIKLGDTWISYKDLPVGMTLASVGELRDFLKYRSKEEEQDLNLYTFAESMFNGLSFIKEQSYIKNIAELFEVGSQMQKSNSSNMAEKGALKASEFTTKTVKSVLFPNLYRFTYADVHRDAILGEATKDKQSPNLIFDGIEDKVALNFLNGLFQDTPLQDFAGASGKRYDPLGFEVQKDGFVQQTFKEEMLGDQERRKKVWELLLSKRRFVDFPKEIQTTDSKGKVIPMPRAKFVRYSNLRGERIREYIEDNYDALLQMEEKEFKKIMSKIVSQATESAKRNIE